MIRGTAPRELRTALQEVLEYVHAYHGEALRGFSGDATPFEKVRPALEGLLHAEYRRPEKPVSPLIWVGLAIVVLLAGIWLVLAAAGARPMERVSRRAPRRARDRRGFRGASVGRRISSTACAIRWRVTRRRCWRRTSCRPRMCDRHVAAVPGARPGDGPPAGARGSSGRRRA